MKLAAFTVAAAIVASAATASPLLPGGSVSPIPTFANSMLTATPVTATNSYAFTSPGGLYSGLLTSQVFTNCADNPFGPNAYSFLYVISNDALSANSIGRFTVNGYGLVPTDVGMDPFVPFALTQAFENTRQADGDSLGWSFVDLPTFGRLTPGSISRAFVVHTPATTYYLNDASVIDGDIAVAQAYAPLPTPGAGALLGLGTLAAFRRRR